MPDRVCGMHYYLHRNLFPLLLGAPIASPDGCSTLEVGAVEVFGDFRKGGAFTPEHRSR